MFGYISSLVATVAALPIVGVALRWRNILDVPTQRSLHDDPVHRGGGAACLVGVLVGSATSVSYGDGVQQWLVVGLVGTLALVGLVDDIWTLAPGSRLAGQLVIGGAAGWVVGKSIGWLCVGVLVVATFANVVNFMDGINGITGLSIAVWSATTMVLASRHHDHLLFLIAAVAGGAALGFLPANVPQARLFLGDIGSYLFGGLVGAGVLVSWVHDLPALPLIAPMTIYLADTGVTLARRALGHESLMKPHREHVYQRLVSDTKLPHVAVAGYVAGLSAVISATWLWSSVWVSVPTTTGVLVVYLCSPTVARRTWLSSPDRAAAS